MRFSSAIVLLSLVACDNLGEDRVGQLEREVRALRAAQSAAPADVAGALAPLRNALDMLVQRGDLERTRSLAVTQELAQLATLMQGFVDAGRRAEVETLRGRVLELDRQIKEQSKAQGEERDLLLKALDLTATKLEAFLRQVGGQKTELPAAGPERGVRKSWQDPAVLWPVGLSVLGLLAILLLVHRSRRAVSVVPLDLPVVPDVVVDAPLPGTTPGPPPGATAMAGTRTPSPVAVRVTIGSGDGDLARERVMHWLAAEPRVLTTPAPEFELRGALLHVRFLVPHDLPAAERASLQAGVQLRGLPESAAGRRSA